MQNTKQATAGQDRIFILEKMPVNKAIWTLGLPTMAAMLIQVIYNMTDTFYIGKLNDPNMVAGIVITMPIFFGFQACGNIFAAGGASLISRLLGRGERETAGRASAIAFWSATVIFLIVTVIGLLFHRRILLACGASPNTIGYATSYALVMFMGSPFVGLQHALSGLLRSEGATKEAMIGMISGSILNMILDPIFIFGFGLGVSGAAIATVLSNIAGFCYYLAFYLRKKSLISISPRKYRFDLSIYGEIFKIGIPASVGMVLMSLGFTLTNVVASGFGDNIVAANGVVMRITNIAVMITMGLSQGCQPLMGYNYGAKKYNRLIAVIRRALTISTVIGTAFTVIFYFLADTWIRVFINDPEVIYYGVRIIHAMIIALPIMGVQMVLMTMFQSLGKAIESLIISLGRQGLFYIPALFLFSNLWGFDGFRYSHTFGDIATTCLSVAFFFRLRRQLFAAGETPKEEAAYNS